MNEQKELIPAPRKPRRDKGVPRKSRPVEGGDQAPIHVRVRLKGMEPFEFGCSQHSVEGGFHVFYYPSLRDRYRQTRREISLSEVIDIEITAAFDLTRPAVLPSPPIRILPAEAEDPPRGDGRPVIHSAKDDALRRFREIAAKEGPVKLEKVPEINQVKVSLGGSDG